MPRRLRRGMLFFACNFHHYNLTNFTKDFPTLSLLCFSLRFGELFCQSEDGRTIKFIQPLKHIIYFFHRIQ